VAHIATTQITRAATDTVIPTPVVVTLIPRIYRTLTTTVSLLRATIHTAARTGRLGGNVDVNTTIAHLGAEIAELRERLMNAEKAAIHWKGEYEKMHQEVHHLSETNHAYAERVDELEAEALARELDEELDSAEEVER
jgi:FtsZ-binding cell division protein ZapB